MGRIIDITFNDKTYSLEFDRYSVLKFMETQKSGEEGISSIVNLFRSGLMKHHSHEELTDDEIIGILISMGDDLNNFAKELYKCIEEVVTALKSSQSGNLKWGVRK